MTNPDETSAPDAFVQSLFAQTNPPLEDDHFTRQVMDKTATQRRKQMVLRAALTFLLVFAAMPLEDYALRLAHVLLVSLVEIDNVLVAQVLAPINSVGGVLSAVLLALRLFHKRLFV